MTPISAGSHVNSKYPLLYSIQNFLKICIRLFFNSIIITVQRETFTNPHFNSFDEINVDKLLDIVSLYCLTL